MSNEDISPQPADEAGVEPLRTWSRTRLPCEQTGGKYECRVIVRVGKAAVWFIGRGDTADAAREEASRSFEATVDNIRRFEEIWKRSTRFNWWAAEHSKEIGQ